VYGETVLVVLLDRAFHLPKAANTRRVEGIICATNRTIAAWTRQCRTRSHSAANGSTRRLNSSLPLIYWLNNQQNCGSN